MSRTVPRLLRRHALPLSGLLAVLTLAAYVQTGFILDDYFHLARAGRSLLAGALDYAIRTDDHAIVLWVHPDPVQFEFFRPLSAFSMWLERHVWRLDARGYHLTNIALHLLNAWMVSRLGVRAGLRPAIAASAALAWAVGIHAIPAVGWISGRTEVLWGTFALAAALCLIRASETAGRRWFVASVTCGTLAACAKETGLMAPVLAMVAVALAARHRPEDVVRPITRGRAAALLAPSVVVLLVRGFVVGWKLPPGPYLDVPHGVTETAWTLTKPALYLGASALQLPLSHWGPLDWMHAHPWTLPLLVALTLVLLPPLGRAAGRSWLVLGLAWFLAALLPVMPIRPTSLYLYMPTVGIVLLVAAAYQRSLRRAFAAWLVLGIVVGIGANVVVERFFIRTARTSEALVIEAERLVRAHHAARLVTIDTPVLLYALPAAVQLRAPDLKFETWFVNFVPRIRGSGGSRLTWRDDLDLEIAAGSEGFLGSQFERFLAFGGAPSRARPVPGGPLRIVAEGGADNPRRLFLTFKDPPTRRETVVVQFLQDTLSIVEPSAPLTAGAPRRSLSSTSSTLAPRPTR